MLRRLASGAALVTTMALVLAGCTPPEPSDAELSVRARDTFDKFYQVVDSQFAAGRASPGAFQAYATPRMAELWAGDIRAALESGTSSSGVLVLKNLEVRDRSETTLQASLCTDGSEIRSSDADGNVIAPSGLVPWEAVFVISGNDGRLLIDDLQPSEDASVCNF
jgi:hypothetical protein